MVELQYFGHSFFKIKDGKETILIDPIFDSSVTFFEKKRALPSRQKEMKNIS